MFFYGEFRTRTVGRFVLSCATVAIAAIVWTFSTSGPPQAIWPFRGVALLIGALGLLNFAEWCSGKVRRIRITADGVETDGRVLPLTRVAKLGAKRHNLGVVLYTAPPNSIGGRRFVWTTPLLTEGEYHALRRDLERYFADAGIAVSVDVWIEQSD